MKKKNKKKTTEKLDRLLLSKLFRKAEKKVYEEEAAARNKEAEETEHKIKGLFLGKWVTVLIEKDSDSDLSVPKYIEQILFKTGMFDVQEGSTLNENDPFWKDALK